MQMHAGERVRPVVRVGDRVSEGQIIGRGASDEAPAVHAPIPGRITVVGTTRVASGHTSEAVAIELDGEFERLGAARRSVEWRGMSPDQLHEAIVSGGVVTTDRRAVAAAALYRKRRGASAKVLVLDIAETEPYLSADAQVALAYPREVLEGCMIVARLLTPRAVRALVRVHTRALKRVLLPHLEANGVELRTADQRYPGNDPFQLETHCLDRDDRAAYAEVVTIAPGTAHAIWEAVVLGKPQIERVITIGGSAVRRPAYVRVRVGTSVADVLNEARGLIELPAQLQIGGMVTGQTISDVSHPVTKASGAILALTDSDLRAHTPFVRSLQQPIREDSSTAPADTRPKPQAPAEPDRLQTLSTTGWHSRLLFAASIALAPGLLRDGGTRLLVALAAMALAICLEWARGAIKGQAMRSSDAVRVLYYGLFVVALAPYSASLGVIALATVGCIVLGYWAPGGAGRFWIHPAIVGLALAYLLTGTAGSEDTLVAASQVGQGLGARLNVEVLSRLSIRVSEGFWERFVGVLRPATPAGHLLPILIASLIVYGEDLAPPYAALGVLITHSLTLWLLGGLPVQLWAGAPFTGMVGGNLPFLMVFALAEPSVRPARPGGAVAFGLITGCITALLYHGNGTVWPGLIAFIIAGSLSCVFDRVRSAQ